MIELARAQDEEVGDGTTSVIITAGEILTAVEGFLEREIHPTVIVNAYFKALEEIVKITESLGVSEDMNIRRYSHLASCHYFASILCNNGNLNIKLMINCCCLCRNPLISKMMLICKRSCNPVSAPSSHPSGAP